ncbi:hypothetical protein FAI41_00155 [Acetobacteraceae bacterium]|nr:hypothetical protein FAI41_00155 [Acetobacteraceae bacterium]
MFKISLTKLYLRKYSTLIVRPFSGAAILFKEALPILLLLTVWDLLVVIGFLVFNFDWLNQSDIPIALLGSVLAIIVGIRNNAAYDRWWEARSLWGSVTNNCRNFGRDVMSLLDGDIRLMKMIALYPEFLKCGLQESLISEPIQSELKELIPLESDSVLSAANPTDMLLCKIGILSSELASTKQNVIGILPTLDRSLFALANAQGGLERISKTPLPVQYTFLPAVITRVFCIILPLTGVQALGWWTPLGSSFIGVFFEMLNQSGISLQNPFSKGPHALPLQTICNTIKTNIYEMTGWKPPEPTPIIGGIRS